MINKEAITMNTTFIIYTKHSDDRSVATKRTIERMGLSYNERPMYDLTSDNERPQLTNEARKLVNDYGLRISPLVIALQDNKAVEYWCDYRQDKLRPYGDLL